MQRPCGRRLLGKLKDREEVCVARLNRVEGIGGGPRVSRLDQPFVGKLSTECLR